MNELRALHGALMEAKFREDPLSPALPSSPYLAALSHRVVDALEAATHDGWPEWRCAERHEHRFPVVLKHVSDFNGWPQYTVQQKREIITTLLAPLIATQETISELIALADAFHSTPALPGAIHPPSTGEAS